MKAAEFIVNRTHKQEIYGFFGEYEYVDGIEGKLKEASDSVYNITDAGKTYRITVNVTEVK